MNSFKKFIFQISINPYLMGIISGFLVFTYYSVYGRDGEMETVYVPGFLYGMLMLPLFRYQFNNSNIRSFFWVFFATLSFFCAFYTAFILSFWLSSDSSFLMEIIPYFAGSIVGATIACIGFRFTFHGLELSSFLEILLLLGLCASIYVSIKGSFIDELFPVSDLFLFVTWQTTLTLLLYKSKKVQS